MPTRAQQTLNLDAEVSAVRYAHGKRLDGLHELGIFTIRDLLEHYPFRYDDFSRVVKIIDLPMGEKNAVLGVIHEAKGRRTAKGGFIYEVAIRDSTGLLRAIWFNQRWLAGTLTVGKTIMLLGRVEHQGGFAHMTSPLYTVVAAESAPKVAAEKPQAGSQLNQPRASEHDQAIASVENGPNPVGIAPVYRANSKISTNWIKRIVLESRQQVLEPLDPIPPEIRIRRDLMSRQLAWLSIHNPQTPAELDSAHRRLAYEQVFFAQLGFAYDEIRIQHGLAAFEHSIRGPLMNELLQQLPFALTPSQKQAVNQICTDMGSPQRMNRLLLGDVGSGKTVVALHALIAAVQSGWQAAMMAPTEVLAQQYASALGPIFAALSISWILLTSALSASERKLALADISTGKISIVMGTHALLEPDVCFRQLSLIVVDEQHRFGVEHRNSLIGKSPAADYLSMTATPIPRSYALVLYGNVQASYLANRPAKAKTSTTNLDSSVAYRAYDAIRAAIGRHEQAFIVCPFISAPATREDEDESYLDDLEAFEDEPYIAAAETELEHLRKQVFPASRIELLTSRVKSEEKQRIMSEFKAGEIDIIVSTTVIEVGIDVANATVMVILDANRFGLAQLHQLRGRVGRGQKDAQVFLVSTKPGENAKRRLHTLELYDDGLKLAEADLAERQEGDIEGTRQHGASSLSLINVIRDSALIEAAHQDVASLLAEDPDLSNLEHQHLRLELLRMLPPSKN